MSNINDLRATLFEALKGIKDGSLDLDKARAINEVSKTIIDSAKVEVDYIRANQGGESSFLDAIGNNNLPAGITGVVQHRIR